MSGGKSRSVDPTASLSWMVKPEPAGISRSIDRTATSSTRARGGASDRIRSTKASTASTGPAISIRTCPALLTTLPSSPSCAASRHTNGRNPTPWTTPRTSTARATRSPRAAGFSPRARSASCTGCLSAVRSVGRGRATTLLSHTRPLQVPPARRPTSEAKRSRLRPCPHEWLRGNDPMPPCRRLLRRRPANPATQPPPGHACSAGIGPRPGATP